MAERRGSDLRRKFLLDGYEPSEGETKTLGDCLYYDLDLRAICRNPKCRHSTWLSTLDLTRRLGLEKRLSQLRVRCNSCKQIGSVKPINAEDLAH